MGIYLNPGNVEFQKIINGEYIDKTGIIALINSTIGTTRKLFCISRPRAFGKSVTANMLCAYYDCSCDSHKLFDGKEIASSDKYLKHLNSYNVISLDITKFISKVKSNGVSLETVTNEIVKAVHDDIKVAFPEYATGDSLNEDLIHFAEGTGRKFVFIIDEWDALIREAKGKRNIYSNYLNLLRSWFKNNNFTSRVVAAAYMTGILPIKKDDSQSAISNFTENSILAPDKFAGYVGFTEKDVKNLCNKYDMSYEEVKKWYGGYIFNQTEEIYNPYSVMCAMKNMKMGLYWGRASETENLLRYMNFDFDGLQEIIARLISGEKIEVETDSFENDFESFRSRDDVLTLLIHLGYLTWDDETKMAHIPNEEVYDEFKIMMKRQKSIAAIVGDYSELDRA
ncbi:MAG: AAA family ATPase [Lachnospiraceae bacterium]|nr:AAA family ATPase [Lachnospiraceae bacterium]